MHLENQDTSEEALLEVYPTVIRRRILRSVPTPVYLTHLLGWPICSSLEVVYLYSYNWQAFAYFEVICQVTKTTDALTCRAYIPAGTST